MPSFPYSRLPSELKSSILHSFSPKHIQILYKVNRELNTLIRKGNFLRKVDSLKIEMGEWPEFCVKIDDGQLVVKANCKSNKPQKGNVSVGFEKVKPVLWIHRKIEQDRMDRVLTESLGSFEMIHPIKVLYFLMKKLKPRALSFRMVDTLDVSRSYWHEIESKGHERYLVDLFAYLSSVTSLSRLEIEAKTDLSHKILSKLHLKNLDLLKLQVEWKKEDEKEKGKALDFIEALKKMNIVMGCPIISWGGTENLWNESHPINGELLIFQLQGSDWGLVLQNIVDRVDQDLNESFWLIEELGCGNAKYYLEKYTKNSLQEALELTGFKEYSDEVVPVKKELLRLEEYFDQKGINRTLKWRSIDSTMYKYFYEKKIGSGKLVIAFCVFDIEWPTDMEWPFEHYMHHVKRRKTQMVVKHFS